MIVDCWVVGSQNYRPLKPSGRALIITQAVQNPTETIDDIPVIRPQLNRPLDHLFRPVQMQPLINPGVAEVIENKWLFRTKLEGMQKVGLRLRPLLRAFVGNAARVKQRPMRLGQFTDPFNRLAV